MVLFSPITIARFNCLMNQTMDLMRIFTHFSLLAEKIGLVMYSTIIIKQKAAISKEKLAD